MAIDRLTDVEKGRCCDSYRIPTLTFLRLIDPVTLEYICSFQAELAWLKSFDRTVWVWNPLMQSATDEVIGPGRGSMWL